MTNSKHTKRALCASVLSILLCAAMLVGSTFAWFTDSVTSGRNKIVAGNLDVELEYTTDFENWKSVQDAEDLFQKDALWEPGYAEVVYLRLRNAGSLALKYRFAMQIESEQSSYNVDGKFFKLSQYLRYGMVEGQQAKFATREDAIAAVENPATLTSYTKAAEMTPGDELYLAMVVFMPTTVGNEANWREKYSSTKAPSIELGLNLYATQVPHEQDSFGPDYDEPAFGSIWDGESETSFEELEVNEDGVIQLNSAADFVGAFKTTSKLENRTVSLNGNIDLNNNKWLSKSITNVTIEGNGNTISGLNATSALFDTVQGDSVIRNLTLEGTVKGRKVAAFAVEMWDNSVIENCISNVNVTATTKAGGIVNMTNTNSAVTIKNCVNNGTVTGKDNGVGGIIGYVNKGTTVTGCVNNGAVSGGNYAGGIAGYVTGGGSTFTDCVNKADVTGTGTVGGVVSFFSGGGNPFEVTDCGNEGTLTGVTVGALVGRNNAVIAEIEYTEKTEVTGYPIIGLAAGTTTLTNVIGDDLIFNGTVTLNNTELEKLTLKDSNGTITADADSVVHNLTITGFKLTVAANTTLKLGAYTGSLVGADDTSKLILNGEAKTWSTAEKAWK